ncbi:hypothetical protein [Pseudomonas sp. CMR5c]|uniref:hypothetical protein n=1 Tax=Pseudomonas sp. CMR5c TaxID=658630 RepID=UPI00210B0F43|nr:hypothetical protein [Pseudomonas sp. CMR5c]
MSEIDELPETYPFDKVPEKRMAQLIGTTQRALESKRARGGIPEGVWNKIDNRIFYSIRRYEAWQESQWDCPQELNLLVIQSESDSPGNIAGAKPSPSHKRQRGSKRPRISVLT